MPLYAYIVSTLGASSIGTSFAHMLCFAINKAITFGWLLVFFFPITQNKSRRKTYFHTYLSTYPMLRELIWEKLKLRTSDLSEFDQEFDPTSA